MDEFERLTQAAIGGDRDALEALLERCLPELRAFVRLRAGGGLLRREGESDLVQSVCREVLANADRFQHPGQGAFKRWLYTTALRKILHRHEHNLAARRDMRRDEPITDREGLDRQLLDTYARFTSPSGKAVMHEEIERIESAMASLSDEQREVITLAHIVGLSRAEIAADLGKSEGAVRTTLYRAMAALAVAMGE